MAVPDGDGVAVAVGPRARGCEDGFGRAAKNRGGRLNVGTSSQKGACGSSAKYRLASGSPALPLASIRNGPISQSAGMARTMKKTAINPAKKSRKPAFRRRRRFRSLVAVSPSSPRFCDFTGSATASSTAPTSAGLPGSGTMASTGGAGTGVAPATGPPTSLASRSSSLSLSRPDFASFGRTARQGVRRICAHPIARRLRRLFHAWPFSHAAVTGLPRRVYDRVAAVYAARAVKEFTREARPWRARRGDGGGGDRRSGRPAVPC